MSGCTWAQGVLWCSNVGPLAVLGQELLQSVPKRCTRRCALSVSTCKSQLRIPLLLSPKYCSYRRRLLPQLSQCNHCNNDYA